MAEAKADVVQNPADKGIQAASVAGGVRRTKAPQNKIKKQEETTPVTNLQQNLGGGEAGNTVAEVVAQPVAQDMKYQPAPATKHPPPKAVPKKNMGKVQQPRQRTSRENYNNKNH